MNLISSETTITLVYLLNISERLAHCLQYSLIQAEESVLIIVRCPYFRD